MRIRRGDLRLTTQGRPARDWLYRSRRSLHLILCGLVLLGFLFQYYLEPLAVLAGEVPVSPGPEIGEIRLNTADYPGGQIPRYAKLEITFQIETVAKNLQLPYDAAPPPGIEPEIGIRVDALFTPDNWRTVYTQPAFYYQHFEDRVIDGREWFYPTGEYSWKVRFAPPAAGRWQFRIVARDASGISASPAHTFFVQPSGNPGFIRVSQRDPRYFEFENGDYFPALGYNMNYDHLSWNNPVLDNRENFRVMSQNGIQLVRIWLSQWGIYGASWNHWHPTDPEKRGRYIPEPGLTFDEAFPGSDVSMALHAEKNPCMFLGFGKAPPALRPQTTYRVRIRLKAVDIAGPVEPGKNYGFVAKTGRWLAGDGEQCASAGTGSPVTGYVKGSTDGWEIVEGRLFSGERYFLPYFYLALENARRGSVYIDRVWIEEVRDDGTYGPNIISRPWMAHHLYMDQRSSYAFDKVLALAETYNIYLRPVVHEKQDWIMAHTDSQGLPVRDSATCRDDDPENDPERCPGPRWFYGDFERVTKVRWLQQAWWRYLQARWGYSTHIHSWELLNEGDPKSKRHFALANEFGRYMRQFYPNHHLVSTSFWHSFPQEEFWDNRAYPYIDFADFHEYRSHDDPYFQDPALWTYETSLRYGALQPEGAGKPIIRGEVGFIDGNGRASPQLESDRSGIWLHDMIWGGLNPGGLIESYWFDTRHIYRKNRGGTLEIDHRTLFASYYHFIRAIPLNNGHYEDARAQVSGGSLRAWGQKDSVNSCAHLWIDPLPAGRGARAGASGQIRLLGIRPNHVHTILWWDTYQADPSKQIVAVATQRSTADGELVLDVNNLQRDTAVQILSGDPQSPNPACFAGMEAVRLVQSSLNALDER